MTAFFIPGVSGEGEGSDLELAYGDMRRRLALDMGRLPRPSRIEKLWARRGSVDCMTEVGRPDPLRGGTVLAIFDMGPRQPFVIWRRPELDPAGGCCEVLGWSAYAVHEFDA